MKNIFNTIHKNKIFFIEAPPIKNPWRLRKKISSNYKTFFKINFSLHEKFIYFPLQLQPEMTTPILGGFYCDQLLALEY